MPFNDQLQNTGLYIQQTPNFDVSQFYEVDIKSQAFKDLLVLMYQQINNLSIVVNNKVSGYNLTQEFVTSKLFFPAVGFNPNDLRPGYSVGVDCSPLPVVTQSYPHGLSYPVPTTYNGISIIGCATNPATGEFRPMPYVDVDGGGTESIQVKITSTNVIITTGGMDYSAWNGKVFFEYLKQ